MNRECINNRNIRIIAAYVENRLGGREGLFEGVPFPADRFPSADAFFMNEDEWIPFDQFLTIIRRARNMVDEPHFYFNCGASSAVLRSWGRLHYFVRIIASPDDGFKRLPFFNRQFNDTKEIEVIAPPAPDPTSSKTRTTLKVQFNRGMDGNRDYVGDPFLRGIIASIPTIWGLEPARIRQPLNPYDPVRLLNEEPEFIPFGLEARMSENDLTVRHPERGNRCIVGKKVFLEPEQVNGRSVFLGRSTELPHKTKFSPTHGKEAVLITETVCAGKRILLKSGEIFQAPYFILDVLYDRFSLLNRLSQILRIRKTNPDPLTGLTETVTRLRETVATRNRAYAALNKAHDELSVAKARVEAYAKNLETMVDERIREYRLTMDGLLHDNRELESKLRQRVEKYKKYEELRRYLSPKLTDRILSEGDGLLKDPQRKMMTVLFSDIRGFSSLTDSLEPEEIFHLLDRYLSEMTALIHQYDGTLNKINGDGLLVFFGDPVPMEDHAERAVFMAVDMQKQVAALKGEWIRYGHELGVGIGINTGFMTVGNIGSDLHRDYTVIGNQVNVAARLESLAQAGQILVSRRTYSRVSDSVAVEELGEIRVKGIHQPVETFRVLY